MLGTEGTPNRLLLVVSSIWIGIALCVLKNKSMVVLILNADLNISPFTPKIHERQFLYLISFAGCL